VVAPGTQLGDGKLRVLDQQSLKLDDITRVQDLSGRNPRGVAQATAAGS